MEWATRGDAWRWHSKRLHGDASGEALVGDGKEKAMDSINHAKRFFLRGNQLLARADFEHAIPEYTLAIQNRPHYPEAYHNRGIARYGQNDLVGAFTDYCEALRLSPRYVQAYTNRGVVRYAGGDLAGAITDCNAALSIDPGCAEAYNARGCAAGSWLLYLRD